MKPLARFRRREDGGRRTPIVAMTADALPEYRQRCLDAGMDVHLAKPVSARDLGCGARPVRVRRPSAAAGPAIDPAAFDEVRQAMGPGFGAVVERYLEDAGSSLVALRDAASRRDDRAVEHIAHRLKGSSGVVAARTVVRLCQRLVDHPARRGPHHRGARRGADARARTPADIREETVTGGKPSSVLLADDHAVVRLGLRTLIDHQPDLHVVAEAETGPQAIARFLEVSPTSPSSICCCPARTARRCARRSAAWSRARGS